MLKEKDSDNMHFVEVENYGYIEIIDPVTRTFKVRAKIILPFPEVLFPLRDGRSEKCLKQVYFWILNARGSESALTLVGVPKLFLKNADVSVGKVFPSH